jgi:hypothetical protein
LKAGLNYSAGLKLADIDKLRIIEDFQNLAAQEMKGDTRTMSKVYVPKELEPGLSPFKKKVVRASKELEREGKDIRKRRDAAKELKDKQAKR